MIDPYLRAAWSEKASHLKKEIENVNVPLDGWYEISSFKDWIEGVLP